MLVGVSWLILALALLLYQFYGPRDVNVQWDTATEINTAGFYLYRSSSPDGEFILVNKAGELIPSRGNALSGATYTFTDEDIAPGETYFYLIEEVEYNLTSRRYEDEIFAYTVPPVDWWAIVLVAISAFVGVMMLLMGLQESHST
jgi:hypothetical protein